MTALFDTTTRASPVYQRAYQQLLALDPMLARSARTVIEIHGAALMQTAAPILMWAEQRYGPDFMAKYVARIRVLNELQARFQAAPSAHTVGCRELPIQRELYDLALLLSLIYSNHRFEILQALRAFLRFVQRPHGCAAAIGIGTGYELYEMTTLLGHWDIEGYDADADAQRDAGLLLQHFAPRQRIKIRGAVELQSACAELRGRYDALVMCELLEHLAAPLRALQVAAEYLAVGGHAFVTMAINLAQEDHVFWYRTVEECREQALDAGLKIVREWLMPVTFHSAAPRPAATLTKGNYAAIVTKCRGSPQPRVPSPRRAL